ncbi:MAG: NAD(P)H-dependent glycerol-3-phosphate dehydrogenase, partial [Longimicrobiales bacterium]
SLANLLAGKGETVRLWAREPEVAAEINERHSNSTFLPDLALDPGVRASTDLETTLAKAAFVVWVTPVQFSAPLLGEAGSFLSPGATLVNCSKGIEAKTLRRMDQIFKDSLPAASMERFCVLSGPSFAKEVSAGVPTAVVVASESGEASLAAQRTFQTDSFRVYTNSDVIGVEVGGALKNVIALAAGVVAGLGLGHNTIAALITRGLAEIRRLGIRLGAQPETFAGLAGMGDLVLTCTGAASRNRTVGFRLGEGESLPEILSNSRTVAEGVATTDAACRLAESLSVEMPICFEVRKILEGERSPREAVHQLMTREPKSEDWL